MSSFPHSTILYTILVTLVLVVLQCPTISAFEVTNSCLDDNNKIPKYLGVSYPICQNLVNSLNLKKLSLPLRSDGTVALAPRSTLVLIDQPFCHVKIINTGSVTGSCNVARNLQMLGPMANDCPTSLVDRRFFVGAWGSLTQGCNFTVTGDKDCASLGRADAVLGDSGCGALCGINARPSQGVCRSCSYLAQLDLGVKGKCGKACAMGSKPVGKVCKTCSSLQLPLGSKASTCGAPCPRDSLVVSGKCQPQIANVLKKLGASSAYISKIQKANLNTPTKATSAIRSAFVAVAKPPSSRRDIIPPTLVDRSTTGSCTQGQDLPPPVCVDGTKPFQNPATISDASTNGCGPETYKPGQGPAAGWKVGVNIFLNTIAPQFYECCNAHDKCFGRCNAPGVSPGGTVYSCAVDMATCLANTCTSASFAKAALKACTDVGYSSLLSAACVGVLEQTCALEMVAYPAAVDSVGCAFFQDEVKSGYHVGTSNKCKCRCTPPVSRQQVIDALLSIYPPYDSGVKRLDERALAASNTCKEAWDAATTLYDADDPHRHLVYQKPPGMAQTLAASLLAQQKGPFCDELRDLVVARRQRIKTALGTKLGATCQPSRTNADLCHIVDWGLINFSYPWYDFETGEEMRYIGFGPYYNPPATDDCVVPTYITPSMAECMADDILRSYCDSSVVNPTKKCLYA